MRSGHFSCTEIQLFGGHSLILSTNHTRSLIHVGYFNCVRGDGRGIYYLDHCLFFSRDLREHAIFPEVELFEDTYFCARLRRVRKPVRLPVRVITSSVRFRNGLARQAILNQVIKILFYLRVPEDWMNRIYERGLSLNKKV